MLIWGELDARASLSVAHQFERAITDAKLVVISAAVMSATCDVAGGPAGRRSAD